MLDRETSEQVNRRSDRPNKLFQERGQEQARGSNVFIVAMRLTDHLPARKYQPWIREWNFLRRVDRYRRWELKCVSQGATSTKREAMWSENKTCRYPNQFPGKETRSVQSLDRSFHVCQTDKSQQRRTVVHWKYSLTTIEILAFTRSPNLSLWHWETICHTYYIRKLGIYARKN